MKHGSPSGYNHHGCRCDKCKEARRVYQRDYRVRKPEKGRGYVRLSSKAAWILVDRHRDEYQGIRDKLVAEQDGSDPLDRWRA